MNEVNANVMNRKPRNAGIELLRIVSMISVMVLHVLGQGGVLSAVTRRGAGYYLLWLLEIMCFFGVTCYGLISGYVGIDGNYRLTNIVYVWLQVVFYTVIITVIFAFAVPESVGTYDLVSMFFPAITGKYWYFSAYMGMFFLIPLVNLGINALKKKYLNAILVTMVLFFSVLSTIFYTDAFNVRYGYSIIWLLTCYFIGAYMKRFGLFEKIKTWKLWGIFFLCVLATWGFKMIVSGLLSKEREDMLMAYNSPTVLLMAMVLVVIFARIKMSDTGFIRKVVLRVAPLTFGVYLINTNPYIFAFLMRDRFAKIAQYPSILAVISVILNALVIFLICVAIDAVRKLIFDLGRLRERLYALENRFADK